MFNEPRYNNGMGTEDVLATPHGSKTFRLLVALFGCLPLVGLLLATVVAGNWGQAFAEQAGNAGDELRVAFTAGVFPEVDQRDAKAAMQIWTKQLSVGMGIKPGARAVFFNRTEDMIAAVNRGELALVILPVVEYLRFRNAAAMRPAIVSQSIEGGKRRFVLVVRRDSGIKTVKDLRGKSLLLPSRKTNSVGHIWIDVLLLGEGLPDAAKHCKYTRESVSASQSLMSVFFKQSDAAVTTRGAFEIAGALNPQITEHLFIMAESDALLGDVTCFPNNVGGSVRRSVENAAFRLHENIIGKQVCTLFQIDRTIPFQPSHLAGLEKLLRERERLTVKASKTANRK